MTNLNSPNLLIGPDIALVHEHARHRLVLWIMDQQFKVFIPSVQPCSKHLVSSWPLRLCLDDAARRHSFWSEIWQCRRI